MYPNPLPYIMWNIAGGGYAQHLIAESTRRMETF